MARPRTSTIDQATTERLLSAAEGHFGREGFAGARLEDIAREAGISRPSLLYHFKSKEELYTAVVQRAFTQLGDGLARAMGTTGTFAERLDATIGGYLKFLDEHPAIAQVVLREFLSPSEEGREVLITRIRPLLDVIARFLQHEGRAYLRPGLPVREAILQLGMAALVRSAAGDLRLPLWGEVDETGRLARLVFLSGGDA
jgi:AcrR family transcriptional regulator